MFRIFSTFDSLLQPHFVTRNLHDRKDRLFQSIIETTKDSFFGDPDVDIPSNITAAVHYEVFRIYVRNCLSELGIKVCDQLKVEKKLTHIKQVLLDEANPTPNAKRFKAAPSDPTEEPIPSTIAKPQPGESAVPGMSSENICAICNKECSSKLRFLWVNCTRCGFIGNASPSKNFLCWISWKLVSGPKQWMEWYFCNGMEWKL